MDKFILSIVLFINSIFGVYAQKLTEAETLINNFTNTVKTSAISSNFTFKISEKKPVNSQTFQGKFILKGNQFYLEMSELKVWFNGKTQWSLVESNREVNITEPTQEELAQTNPVAVIGAFRKVSKLTMSKTPPKNLKVVIMTPIDKKQEFQQIQVRFNKTNGNLQSVYIKFKEGNSQEIIINKYEKNTVVNANTFVFDKNKFKGITLNDLR